MKIQLENIQPDDKSSFRLLHNPKLNDLFFWHFHPEFELVYIEGEQGTRHVGRHISTFSESDLVLIGSNIPHLNFDYGIKTDYRKEVLHISASFKEKIFNEIEELIDVYELLEKSQHGLVFYGKTKELVGNQMKQLHKLNTFEQFLKILRILKLLAKSDDFELLHPKPIINNKAKKQQLRLQRIYSYIDEHYSQKIQLAEVAKSVNLGKEAFCRYFKKSTGSTFTHFLNQYRITQAKRLLLSGKNISETCYECGFESLSYFNRTFKRISGENPSAYKNKQP
ncbi:helix-turn-helix domain-containing protein [Flagellimonas nanhaiensis]|uniref:AraC family transcriptional regulator n=1 Tax=Flagellimonas nanhaiensis TaxID=2292706 RepID=A0A371JQ62_9FLAO|nr:AraC family transcriptional regulator [Allomuricauda nanhaiensis]RDY59650.1 AraC family transcriptional regulator [Allomuricauda nanhaiensis]